MTETSAFRLAMPLIALLAASLIACDSGSTVQIEQAAAEADADATAEEFGAAAESPPAAAPPSAPAPAAPARSAARSQPAPAPQAAPAQPAPPPAPPRIVAVPADTLLEIEFVDGLASDTAQPNDSFSARVINNVYSGDGTAIPAGSIVRGVVTEAVPLTKKIGGRAKLTLRFDTLDLPSGMAVPISAAFLQEGKSETAKDAATIGGATAGGALLGRVLKKSDKGKGTLIGAVVGAAAGTAIAAKTEGEEVVIPAGTVVTIQLNAAADVPQ